MIKEKVKRILGNVSHDVFYSKESEARLREFDAWEAGNPNAYLSLDDAEKLVRRTSSVKVKSEKP